MADFRPMSVDGTRTLVVNGFMRGVYGWMTAGLGLTALTSFFMLSSPELMKLFLGNTLLFFGLIIAELAMVFVLAGAINRLSSAVATGLFLGYAMLNGITISGVLLLYTQTSVVATFVVCAGMFGAMSVYGMMTKKDLTSWGSFLFMGLIGILLASLVNIFLKSSAMSFVVSCIGVLVFTGLTAYDTQKWKIRGETAPMDDALAIRRGTILGALDLYLDFVNLFLMLLRLLGSSRD